MTIWSAVLAVSIALAGTYPLFAAEKNLLPDPGFEQTLKLTNEPPEDADPYELWVMLPWHHYVIEAPSEVQYDQGAVTVTGGKGFLHSAAFPVEAGKTYAVSFKARGGGKVSAGFLWWTRYDDDGIEMADPHWTRMEEPVKTGDDARDVTARFTASEKTTRAYIRLVVTEGTVRASDLKVTLVAAE